jgi:hypothetical protein
MSHQHSKMWVATATPPLLKVGTMYPKFVLFNFLNNMLAPTLAKVKHFSLFCQNIFTTSKEDKLIYILIYKRLFCVLDWLLV